MHRPTNIEKREGLTWLVPPRRVESLLGSLVCVLAALAASFVAAGHAWQIWLPLGFSAVLFLTALVFGTRAGLLGSVLAALIFAVFLFSPTGKLAVANQTARANLAWMILTGVAFSFLFAPSRSRLRHR